MSLWAVVAVAALALWPWAGTLLLGAAVVGVAGACVWWGLRVHRALRERDARWRAQDRLLAANRSLAEVDVLDGNAFELLVAALLRRDGCADVVKVGRTGDNGRDVTGRLPDGRSMIVQCKRFGPRRSVGVRDMRDLLGTRTHFAADVAVFVTTTRFTRQALDLAVANGILVVHRDLLASWLAGASFASVAGLGGRGQGDGRHLARWRRAYGVAGVRARRARPVGRRRG
ncbi:restriction endonuclease [Streptomyces avicenniae]|uniref:restriction endonuclease n=1 Tax=Streptomyces avicenniae TaxID=500153 RepID=UPI001CBA6911|nr:restriction endonuclease [Streptomyces avicenniae]